MNFASFRLTEFFFLVRRYSDASCSQACRKLAAGRELLRGLIHVASEFRLGGGTLFAGREAKFVFGGRLSFHGDQMSKTPPTGNMDN
jgi:hypothetical protein